MKVVRRDRLAYSRPRTCVASHQPLVTPHSCSGSRDGAGSNDGRGRVAAGQEPHRAGLAISAMGSAQVGRGLRIGRDRTGPLPLFLDPVRARLSGDAASRRHDLRSCQTYQSLACCLDGRRATSPAWSLSGSAVAPGRHDDTHPCQRGHREQRYHKGKQALRPESQSP